MNEPDHKDAATRTAAPHAVAALTPAELLAHWQGHRRLTRRIIEQFPEDQLFSFTLGGMRSFGTMAWEVLGVAAYMLGGLTGGGWSWQAPQDPPQERSALLSAWDDLTARLEAELPGVPPERYQQLQPLFWAPMPGHAAALYAVDNEIHHRGQGYVYLRTLDVEPAPFYER